MKIEIYLYQFFSLTFTVIDLNYNLSRTLKLITLKDQNGPDWVQSDIALLT